MRGRQRNAGLRRWMFRLRNSGGIMKPIVSIFAVITCLSVFAVAVRAQDDDPSIDGKTLSSLIKQLKSENRGFQLRAAKTLSESPTNLHAKIVPQVIPILKSERENDRFVAAQVLGDYGPVARAAVPELLPVLGGTQYERNRAAAAKALGQILKDAEPSDEVEKVTQALIAVFEDKYSDVRREAVTACGMIGPAAKSVLPQLPRRLGDSAIPRNAPWTDQGERELVERAAAWTTGRMGPLAACHMDLLVSMVHGMHAATVSEAISRIGATQDNVVPNLMNMIERGNPWENLPAKEAALATLEVLGPKAARAAPLLDRFLRERSFAFREASGRVNLKILKVMKSIGAAAKPYEPTLKQYTELKDLPHASPAEVAELRKAAQSALDALAGKETTPQKETK
ncbi:MAG: hypothetical protein C0404_11085 [Verrucomicrobia bacterium]|nr:hypothetical protein [Verrucomicrobiota bacterium]